MASAQEQQLGQLQNASGGTAESLYSPGAGETAIVKNVVVCNTSGSADSFRVFIDDDGSTYNDTTALFYDVVIAANTTIVLNVLLYMNDASGNLGVSCATTGACTFTANGIVVTA
jgi:hypothetical protein